jgi:single-strand DNA-binding protein
MASYNKVLMMGNLTRDPELRYTPKGTAITNIDVAINRTYTTENGEQKEEVTYINDIEVWGRQAETTQKYLSKGSPVFVEGRLRLDSWEDKDTKQKRNRLKIVAERIQFLSAPRNAEFQGGEEGGGSAPPRRAAPRSPAQPAETPAAPEQTAAKDDIPF